MDEEAVSTDSTGASWLDAFPWLEAAARRSGGSDSDSPWWHEPLDEPGTPLRSQRLEIISDLAMRRLTDWTIAQVVPGLPPTTPLSALSLSARARTALSRLNYAVASDLLNLKVAEIFSWWHVGIGTAESIVRALADEGAGVPKETFPARTIFINSGPLLPPPPDGDRLDVIEKNLRLIARWNVASGTTEEPLLNPPAKETPIDVREAHRRLQLLRPADVLRESELLLDAAELITREVGKLDHRTQTILTGRFFADRPETLDQLGRGEGITRERIRQIEAQARSHMAALLGPGGALESIALATRQLIGTVLPLGLLIERIPAMANKVQVLDQPVWRIFDRLDDAYEIEDDWCMAPSTVGARAATQAILEEHVDQNGLVEISSLAGLFPNLTLDGTTNALHRWLEYCGYIIRKNFVLTRTRSLGDWAESVLAIVGTPLPAQIILDECAIDRSIGSLKNALGSDERFERVDRDSWALSAWGLDAYTGIRGLIREAIGKGGGEVSLNHLITQLTSSYSVTANSVTTYASSSPFELSGGLVRFAASDRDIKKTPERTRRLYRRGTSWLLRLKVTNDHLRGSGFIAPIALARILGLQGGESITLNSPIGEQPIQWTSMNPSFGSIRRLLVAADVPLDAEIFLVIGDDRFFSLEVVPMMTGNSLHDAYALVGLRAEDLPPPQSSFASAIGLPTYSPASSIIGGYYERGDLDIADLLSDVRDKLEGRPPDGVDSAEIREILDLL